MDLRTHEPETDLLVPLPERGERWDPYTVHTHYFGFCVPDAAIGAFVYIRYMPAFRQCHGGVVVYQGMDNLLLTDAAHVDYQTGMPWPEVDDRSFTTANGLRIEFIQPGHLARITYKSADEATTIDVLAEAVTPLAARGHVMPGEELHTDQRPGGSEQFMRYTGELTVSGERYGVDCHYPRDRSWRQVRTEASAANAHPPITWTPVYFGPELAFNQVGFSAPDTDPLWRDAFDIPSDSPTHHFAWIAIGDEVRNVVRVHRRDTMIHPLTLAPLCMEIEAEDETGDVHRVSGEAIAFTPVPTWPNLASYETLLRWEDESGRVAHGPGQSIWSSKAQHAMRANADPLGRVR